MRRRAEGGEGGRATATDGVHGDPGVLVALVLVLHVLVLALLLLLQDGGVIGG